MNENVNQEWLELLRNIGAKNMPWGVTGGTQWTSYKQTDENDFSVQIFMHDDFAKYKKQRDAIIGFFSKRNSILVNEHEVTNIAFGYWKELNFISKEKVDEKQRNESEKMTPISIGSIYAPGGVVNFGAISDSQISIDNAVHQIEKMIDERGGEDKESLNEFLKETKALVEIYLSDSQIKPKNAFKQRLNAHVAKHGWFYGAILQLIGTAVIQKL
ncbi:MAG: hypothetical protein ACERLG_09620 [Sedimentibacter sp.]